jgi:8-amino-7-oxononanoate synthase
VADPLRFLQTELAALAERGLLRSAEKRSGINVCSNDYLGFAREPVASSSEAGGAGASALVLGHTRAHREAEESLSRWLGAEAALLFSSGYAANLGVVSALAGPGDLVLSDRLNHASIIDGCRLSRATVAVFEHCDVASLEKALRDMRAEHRRCVVVTESYFSMDGDCAPLRRVRELCDTHDAVLVVDEAHAIGVWGAGGRGRCELEDVRPDVLVGTLGKAFGLHGAFVCGSEALRSYLWNRARSFVFSTALPPALADAVRERLPLVADADARRARLFEVAARLRTTLAGAGAHALGEGPIVPWVIGDAAAAIRAERALADASVLGLAIRPPTVPEGTSRLRLTATASMTESELTVVCEALAEVARGVGSAA